MFADFNLEVTRPWLLIGLAIVLPWLVLYFFRSLVDFARWQRIASLVMRFAIAILLALALAGLTMLTPTDRQYIVVAIDESLSVGENAQKKIDEFTKGLKESVTPDSKISYITFSKNVGQPQSDPPVYFSVDAPDASNDSQADQENAEQNTDNVNTEAAPGTPVPVPSNEYDKTKLGSNLEEAIEVAMASVPPFYVPQVVLISDGNETDGDVVRAALAGEIPISTIALPTKEEPEVNISSVIVPAQVRQGEPFYVEVVVDSNHDDQGTIEIYRGDVKVDLGNSSTIKIKKGENRFRFRQEVANQRQVEYAARITGFQDQLLDNNTASGLVTASGKPRVLLVDSDTKTTDPLRWALEEQDIRVDVRPPEGIPDSLSDLQNYEAVLMSNVPATSLSIRQMEVIRTYVQDLGGGLLMLGGDQSFGLGGYYKTTLEEILPVRSDFEKEKEKPSLAMVLVIDRSGSMSGMKMELAKDAAKSAVELLGPRDQIGVVAFDNNSYWVSELHSAADKGYVIERIATIEAGGGTAIYPGMADAFEALQPAVAKLKHVILLTDGHSSPGDFDGITSDMSANRMTVSTVAVGNGADQNLLERIAELGNGRYYFCDDPQSVPQIFAKETVTASKSAINEMPFVPQLVRPTPVLKSLDIETAPFLLGFVVTRPKPTCEFILATESGEPLLVWWRYGLGMSLAFTSDAKSRWAAEWLTWPEFGVFWAQVVRHVMRKADAKGVYVEVERQGSETEVRLDAVDPNGKFRNQAETMLSVIGPNLNTEKKEISMQQVAPGQYVAKFDTSEQGSYHLDLSQKSGAKVAFRQNRGLVVGYPDELRLRPTNEELLKKVSEVSGGHFNATPEKIFDIGDKTVKSAQALWPYLLAAALILFLVDVALRRIDLSLLFGLQSKPAFN